MKAEIISIGNEILIGDIVNTNASWLARVLTEEGLEVTGIHTVADDLDEIKQSIQAGLNKSRMVITTGGLGPTPDDLTKRALQELFDADLKVDPSVLEFIKKTFEKRDIPFSKSNYHQAEVPENAEVLFNKMGTAPGMLFRVSGSLLVVLPGVPLEMKHLVKEKVLPVVRESVGGKSHRLSFYLATAGIGESTLSDEVIGDLKPVLPKDTTVAFLPGVQGTRIRITSSGTTKDEIESRIAPLKQYIVDQAGDLIIGEGENLSLSQAVGNELRRQGLTIAAAESCSGGQLLSMLTDVPGSSDYVTGGLVAYSNEVKISRLNVDREVLETEGAVSKPVALQMARNVASDFKTDIGISTTGIAGPGGGTIDKPVGTVWIGFWSEEKHFALNPYLTDNRLLNKERSAAIALETVRRVLLHIEQMPYGLKIHKA